MSFGEKVKDLRSNAGQQLTQKQLGKICGMDQRKISRIESNITEPSLQDIKELCNYFKVSADYFLELPMGLKYVKDKEVKR